MFCGFSFHVLQTGAWLCLKAEHSRSQCKSPGGAFWSPFIPFWRVHSYSTQTLQRVPEHWERHSPWRVCERRALRASPSHASQRSVSRRQPRGRSPLPARAGTDRRTREESPSPPPDTPAFQGTPAAQRLPVSGHGAPQDWGITSQTPTTLVTPQRGWRCLTLTQGFESSKWNGRETAMN